MLNVTKSHVTKSLFGVMWRKNEKSHVSSGGANEKGEPWFVGRNVARRQGYQNTRDSLRKHVDEEGKPPSQIATLVLTTKSGGPRQRAGSAAL